MKNLFRLNCRFIKYAGNSPLIIVYDANPSHSTCNKNLQQCHVYGLFFTFCRIPTSWVVCDFIGTLLDCQVRKKSIMFPFPVIAGVLHELMHATLEIVDKFGVIAFPKSKRIPGTELHDIVQIIRSYTDDLIIHKKTHSMGYNPISKLYFTDLEKCLRRMRKGNPYVMDIYDRVSQKTGYFFRAYRYILAESLLEFSDWKGKKLIDEFLLLFKNFFKEPFVIVGKIKEIYDKYNILEKDAHDKVLETFLDLAEIKDLDVKIFRYIKNTAGEGYVLK